MKFSIIFLSFTFISSTAFAESTTFNSDDGCFYAGLKVNSFEMTAIQTLLKNSS